MIIKNLIKLKSLNQTEKKSAKQKTVKVADDTKSTRKTNRMSGSTKATTTTTIKRQIRRKSKTNFQTGKNLSKDKAQAEQGEGKQNQT